MFFHLLVPTVYLLFAGLQPKWSMVPADAGSSPDILLLLTGRAFSHVTAGLQLNYSLTMKTVRVVGC
jgi:hypothetical protein